MNLIYYLNTLDYYTYNTFENLCSYLNILLYDSLKINTSELVKIHVTDIKNICKKYNLELIVCLKDSVEVEYYVNVIDSVEVYEESLYKSYKEKFDKIIICTSIENFRNMTDYEHILINDPDNIRDFELFKNDNIGIETDNNNDIWYTVLGLKVISFLHTENVTNVEWSIKKRYNDDTVSYNFINYIKNKKKILITGVTGQDGSILCDYLLKLDIKNSIIIGTIKTISTLKHDNLADIRNLFCPILLDLCDDDTTETIIKTIKPDYFFNCAAQSEVHNTTRSNIENTFLVNTIAPLRHMESINKYCRKCRYLSCGSSEEFGKTEYTPQDMNHPFNPINIYGITKNTTHNIVKYYRTNHNLYCCHVILYNHESVRRGINFITRKISHAIAKIKMDIDNHIEPKTLQVGNIYSKRDWSSCDDIIEAFWKILNSDRADDYILSSGKTHTVKDLIDIGFNYINAPLQWVIKENMLDTKAYYNDMILVEVKEEYYRINDDNRHFQGDNSLSKDKLDWKIKTSFKELIHKMIDNDLILLQK